ncbi:YhgN family NAAT transporter [Buchnera aphidicola (Pemphigus obesinymphae)]|uniref:YhgN family NAAT transporter n=1 Tax=Buchnera aphidicola TaxID=9 RepID=UPI0022377FB0|nr:YhgN family NAAT transporter [Buchnera aphidicola]MCW5196359.1 YhgN family NAAT transporter [Buchnera aphidicola (Pemphigus obesinymphae)]
MTEIISATILLILIMDPLGNLPIFMSVLKNIKPDRRKIVLIREMIISLLIMLLFLFAGEKILSALNLRTETVSISGGIILFLIAIKMIFPSEENINNVIDSQEEPFLVPLAVPLIAGPSLLATLMLLSHQYPNKILYLSGALIIAWSTTVIILLLSELFLRLFSKKGVNALERLMGLILIMLSTQMFLDGIQSWFQH